MMRWLLNVLPDIAIALVLIGFGIIGAICVISIAARLLRMTQ
jgi:uncharacterized SAM-binding protein YcdF (DUF218 family)